jgi:hypothetical protein
MTVVAKKLDTATANRLRALARERTPAMVTAELAAQEAEFQREADWRKQQSLANVPKWDAIRRARGASK